MDWGACVTLNAPTAGPGHRPRMSTVRYGSRVDPSGAEAPTTYVSHMPWRGFHAVWANIANSACEPRFRGQLTCVVGVGGGLQQRARPSRHPGPSLIAAVSAVVGAPARLGPPRPAGVRRAPLVHRCAQ